MTPSSSAAVRRARSWPTGCQQRAPTRSCCAKRARIPRPATNHRKSATAIRDLPISIRASTGPNSRSRTQVVSHNNPQADRPPLRKYEQARVLGGGSSINGQMANRGAPTDYEEWEARGASGWDWNDVLPYFKKVERDLDFDGPFHGKDGRIPVRRIPREHWTDTRKPSPKLASWPATISCPTRTANSSRATSRSRIPTNTSSAFRRRWAISTPRRASAPT